MAIDSKRDQTQEPGQTRGPGLALGWVGLDWTGLELELELEP